MLLEDLTPGRPVPPPSPEVTVVVVEAALVGDVDGSASSAGPWARARIGSHTSASAEVTSARMLAASHSSVTSASSSRSRGSTDCSRPCTASRCLRWLISAAASRSDTVPSAPSGCGNTALTPATIPPSRRGHRGIRRGCGRPSPRARPGLVRTARRAPPGPAGRGRASRRPAVRTASGPLPEVRGRAAPRAPGAVAASGAGPADVPTSRRTGRGPARGRRRVRRCCVAAVVEQRTAACRVEAGQPGKEGRHASISAARHPWDNAESTAVDKLRSGRPQAQ